MNAANLIASYCAAYEALHGASAQCTQHGKRERFHVVNHRGDAFDYSAKELEALTAGLVRLTSLNP